MNIHFPFSPKMENEQVSKVIWQKATSPSCHRSLAFIRRMRCAATFVRGGRRTMCNALMHRHVTMGRHMSSSKMLLPVEDLGPI